MPYKILENLPELVQTDFPPLPEIAKDDLLLIFGSAWNHCESELCAGILISSCAHAGKWQAVSTDEFLATMSRSVVFMLSGQDIVYATWRFVDQGLIKAIQVEETKYFVLTPEFVKMALGERSTLRTTGLKPLENKAEAESTI